MCSISNLVMITIKTYLVLKEAFPDKLSRDPETTGYDLLKDVERIRDNVCQDTSSDITPSHALDSPSHMYQNRESQRLCVCLFFVFF